MADPIYYISAGLQPRKDQAAPDTGDPTYRIAAGLPPEVETEEEPPGLRQKLLVGVGR